MDEDEIDAADVQGLPHEVLDVPDEDDADCGPSEEEVEEFELSRLRRWGMAA
jgi:hypothetical protein